MKKLNTFRRSLLVASLLVATSAAQAQAVKLTLDAGHVVFRAGDRGLVGHTRTAPRIGACTFGARLPSAGIARIGLGGAFVAEIGYFAGLAAPF